MFLFFKNNLLWRDGKYIFLIIFLSTVVGFIFFKPLFIISIVFLIFSIYFFRNPNRICPEYVNDSKVLISPADGKVVEVCKGDFQEEFCQKISIFLSPLDVHVNWLPLNGKINKIIYRPGKFAVAFAPKSSDINERNDLILESNEGRILIRQIAGFIARRICCWVKENEIAHAGQKYGMIRFGSRVDILLPLNVEIKVKVGDKIKGGHSVIGRWI